MRRCEVNGLRECWIVLGILKTDHIKEGSDRKSKGGTGLRWLWGSREGIGLDPVR